MLLSFLIWLQSKCFWQDWANFHLIFKNTLDEKKNFEADVTYSIDFNANKSLSEVEQEKGDEIARNLTDAIFNKIFSNW